MKILPIAFNFLAITCTISAMDEQQSKLLFDTKNKMELHINSSNFPAFKELSDSFLKELSFGQVESLARNCNKKSNALSFAIKVDYNIWNLFRKVNDEVNAAATKALQTKKIKNLKIESENKFMRCGSRGSIFYAQDYIKSECNKLSQQQHPFDQYAQARLQVLTLLNEIKFNVHDVLEVMNNAEKSASGEDNIKKYVAEQAEITNEMKKIIDAELTTFTKHWISDGERIGYTVEKK